MCVSVSGRVTGRAYGDRGEMVIGSMYESSEKVMVMGNDSEGVQNAWGRVTGG